MAFSSSSVSCSFSYTLPEEVRDASSWKPVLCESFDDDAEGWGVGSIDDRYVKGERGIRAGKYIWEGQGKRGFVWWQPAPLNTSIRNFYLAVRGRIPKGQEHTCLGLWFGCTEK